MATALIQKKNPLFAHRKQKYLMAIFGLAIVGIIFVVWWGFLKGEGELTPPAETSAVSEFKKVKIDWQLLEDPQLAEFSLFEEVLPHEGEIGRDNPFIPYK